MKHKKLIAGMLAITILLASSSPSFVSANEVDESVSAKHINYVSTLNKDFTDSIQKNKKLSTKNYNISDISISVQNILKENQIKAIVTIVVDGETLSFPAKGYVETSPSTDGYIGVLDGNVVINGMEEVITIDFNYHSPTDNFTAITIGSAGEIIPQIGEVTPQIAFFGEYSNQVKALAEANIQQKKQQRAKEASLRESVDIPSVSPQAVDATVRYQKTHTVSASGYETATISLYYANQLRNQSSMPVYAKVNSHTASFKEYLKNVQGFNTAASTLLVYCDSYKIEIVASDKYLHSNGVWSPTANTTSQTLTFPAYLPAIGFFTFGVPITMSSTTVATRGIAAGAIYNDNIITFNIYKRYGWNPETLDGYYNNAAGGVVRAYYRYDGNVTSNITTTMGAFGSVRYEYIYTPFLGTSTTLHMWSANALCSNYLTIVP